MCSIVGKMIGKQGVTVKHITADSGAKVSMLPVAPDYKVPDPEIVALLNQIGLKSVEKLWNPTMLTGTAESVVKAFQMCRGLIGGTVPARGVVYAIVLLYSTVLYCRGDR